MHRYSFSIMPFDDFITDATYQERKFKPWKLYITDNGKAVKKLCEKIANSNQDISRLTMNLKKSQKSILIKIIQNGKIYMLIGVKLKERLKENMI